MPLKNPRIRRVVERSCCKASLMIGSMKETKILPMEARTASLMICPKRKVMPCLRGICLYVVALVMTLPMMRTYEIESAILLQRKLAHIALHKLEDSSLQGVHRCIVAYIRGP